MQFHNYSVRKNKHDEILFDGKSYLGKNKSEILNLLGKPNYFHIKTRGIRKRAKKEEQLYYQILTKGNGQGTVMLIFLLNNKVTITSLISLCG